MAINIELSEILRIISRSEDINTEMAKDLADMVSYLEHICENVRSSELLSANSNLTKSIQEVSNSVSTNFPKIISFLNSQASSYSQTTESAKTQIDSLVTAVNNSFGSDQ